MKFKPVFRYDPKLGIFRIFRVIWSRGEGAGHGWPNHYHAVFKMAVSKRPFFLKWEATDKVLTFLFFRFTYEKNYGGRPV